MMLGCAALAGVQGVQAQDPISFEQDFSLGTMVGWPMHRSHAMIADFNNDGLMDLYLNGTSENKGWQSRGVLAKNLGGRQFEGVYDAIMKTDTIYNKVYSTDTLWNDDGSYTLQDSILNGQVVMDTVYSESFVAMANGDPTCLEAFHKPQMHLFNGQLTVIVTRGTAVKVSAKGLRSAELCTAPK